MKYLEREDGSWYITGFIPHGTVVPPGSEISKNSEIGNDVVVGRGSIINIDDGDRIRCGVGCTFMEGCMIRDDYGLTPLGDIDGMGIEYNYHISMSANKDHRVYQESLRSYKPSAGDIKNELRVYDEENDDDQEDTDDA